MKENSEFRILCSNIIYLKNKNKLTQKELSEISGLSLYSISKIKKGICTDKITAETLYRLSKYFKIRIADLFNTMV